MLLIIDFGSLDTPKLGFLNDFNSDFKNAKVKFIHTVPHNTIKIFKSFSGQDQSNQAFRFLRIFIRSEILLVNMRK